jgi:hypothetical protein
MIELQSSCRGLDAALAGNLQEYAQVVPFGGRISRHDAVPASVYRNRIYPDGGVAWSCRAAAGAFKHSVVQK